MSKNITLTIIIPVYNVERYLGGCLDSILSVNGIEDVEIILVDDGSTDDSPGIAIDIQKIMTMFAAIT